MDWTDCTLIEEAPGKMGGRPVIKGTRIEPDTVLIDEEYGRTPGQTHLDFPTLSVDTILKIRAFAHKLRLTPWRKCRSTRTPHTLRHYLHRHDTITAACAGFAGLNNGAILEAAESAGFDVCCEDSDGCRCGAAGIGYKR